MAALTLLIDANFEVDIYDLGDDLHLHPKTMANYYQEIGCRVSTLTERDRARYGIQSKVEAAQHRIARLRVPLVFPKSKSVSYRRKKAGTR
ncbi:MAG: DNA-directed RNA polymerase I subunit rpa49 [Phylliscum demangeonii]|nr:MAG: DNA-directed RNA polymerase I subunit rpa49 [Phylliscum demangeonii]